MRLIFEWVSFSANCLTIFASTIAIYLFLFKREKISLAINVLLNYSIQLSISELKAKLEKLNDFNVDENDNQKIHVLNILNDIKGQIKGNTFLKDELNTLLEDIEKYTDNPLLLKETGKRSLTSELRESLRNIDTLNNLNFISNKTRES